MTNRELFHATLRRENGERFDLATLKAVIPHLGKNPDDVHLVFDNVRLVAEGEALRVYAVPLSTAESWISAQGAAGKVVADMAAAAVLKNNVIFGSVNANKRHWYRAGQILKSADPQWLSRLITRREKPENFRQALETQPDDVKTIIQFSDV